MSYLWDLGQAEAPPAPGPGYVWVPAAGSTPGYWRRARAGETVSPEAALAVTQSVHVAPGVSETRKWDGTKWVTVATTKSAQRRDCEAVLPPQYVDGCVKTANERGVTGSSVAQVWSQCAATGMPAELVPSCYERGLAAGHLGRAGMRTGEAIYQEKQAEEAAKKRGRLLLYGALGLGALGVVWYLRRKRRGEET